MSKYRTLLRVKFGILKEKNKLLIAFDGSQNSLMLSNLLYENYLYINSNENLKKYYRDRMIIYFDLTNVI